jgi:hypothetical protein
VGIETGLHRARIQRGIGLMDLAARTRLSPRVVQQIDEGRFAELPAGLYARAYVRAFAAEVGLEPAQVLAELEPILPSVEDPIDGLREAARQADSANWFDEVTRRLAASGVDAFILLVVDALVIHVVAVTCRVSVGALLDQAAIAVASLCAVPLVLYFLVFEGLGGRTPGGTICNLPELAAAGPLELQAIVMRTVFGSERKDVPKDAPKREDTHRPGTAGAALRLTNDADEQLA